MIISTSASTSTEGGATVSLRDPDTFTQFHIESDFTDAEIIDLFTREGVISAAPQGEEFDVLVTWVIEHAGPASSSPQWQEKFQQMLGYAESKGWYSAEAGTIRAHVAR